MAESAAEPKSQHPERGFYRAAVHLAAELEAEGVHHPIKSIIHNLSATGAEVEVTATEAAPEQGLLILTLPTRAQPLELEAKLVGTGRAKNEFGERVKVLHLSFPTIRSGEQDVIVAFINRLLVLEKQLRRIEATAEVEVITGERAYAKFKGHTRAVRPDYVWLQMDGFDHIEGEDVTLRVPSPDAKNKAEVDGTVSTVREVRGKFEVEIELAEAPVGSSRDDDAGAKLMAFLREHYPRDTQVQADAPVLVPRHIRAPRSTPRPERLIVAREQEPGFPTRAPKSGSDVPLQRQARDAEERALDSILRPPKKPAPQRSI